MTNWVFWGGIIIGFLVARHFLGPMFGKQVLGDVNQLLHNNPQVASNVRQQLSPQQLMQARQQGLNV